MWGGGGGVATSPDAPWINAHNELSIHDDKETTQVLMSDKARRSRSIPKGPKYRYSCYSIDKRAPHVYILLPIRKHRPEIEVYRTV